MEQTSWEKALKEIIDDEQDRARLQEFFGGNMFRLINEPFKPEELGFEHLGSGEFIRRAASQKYGCPGHYLDTG